MICEVGKPFSLISNWGSGHNLSEKLWNLIDVCECSGQTSFYVRKALWKTFKRKEPERQALGRIPGSRPSAQSYIGPRVRPKREALIVLGRQQRRFFFRPWHREVSWLVLWAQSTTKDYIRAEKQNFSPSPSYSFHKSLNHKFLVLKTTTQIIATILESKPRKLITRVFGACLCPVGTQHRNRHQENWDRIS